jgi:CBS domain-containing protein
MPTSSTQQLDGITARTVMRSPVAAVDPATGLADVAALMSTLHIHCVIVDGVARDARGEHLVWGVISDLDLVRGALAGEGRGTAEQLAVTEPLCVDADDDLETVASILVAHACSHVMVVEDERPVGVISTLDLAGVLGS